MDRSEINFSNIIIRTAIIQKKYSFSYIYTVCIYIFKYFILKTGSIGKHEIINIQPNDHKTYMCITVSVYRVI